jgi:hypothetical protein
MKLLAFDTETYLIGAREKAPKPVCCTWYDGQRAFITHPGDVTTHALWSSQDTIFCGVNIPYDLLVMMRWYPYLIPYMIKALDEGRIIDLPLRDGLIHLATRGSPGYNSTISLAELAQKHLGLDLSANKTGDDIWRLKFGTLDGIPFNSWPVDALNYALDDAKHTYNICMQLGDPFKLYPTEEAQNQGAVALAAIGVWGFKVNQSIRGKLKDAIMKQIHVLDEQTKHLGWTGKGSQAKMAEVVGPAWRNKQLKEIAAYAATIGMQVDIRAMRERVNTLDMREALSNWASMGRVPADIPIQFPAGADHFSCLEGLFRALTPVPMKTRGISTAEEYLELIKDEMPTTTLLDGTVVNYGRAYIDLKHKIKMHSTYIEPYGGETVHPRFVPMVATGRTGCREPNCQNIPRKDKTKPEEAFRTMFESRPGRVLGTVDYSQLELCTLAATVRVFYPDIPCRLGEAIDNNIDAHSVLAAQVLGVSYEQVIKNKKIDGSTEAQARQASKPSNFGFCGGLGAPTMAVYAKTNYGVDKPVAYWKQVKDVWKQTWTEMNVYLRDGGNIIQNSGGGRATAFTINGFTKANCFYTELLNFRFQSLAAEGAKRALYAIYREQMLGWYWKNYKGFGYGSDLRDGALADSKTVNFVHDEIVCEHLEGEAGKVAMKRQEQLMVDVMTKTCQNKITIRVEGALSHQWEH